MSDRLDRAAAAAAREVQQLMGAEWDRRSYKIERFGVHRDGYLHARVLIGERSYYFTRQFGCWLAPGGVGGKSVHKEPEGLIGPGPGRALKYELQERAAPFDKARRQQRAREEARANATSEVGRVDDETGADTGVPDRGDRVDAPDSIQPVA